MKNFKFWSVLLLTYVFLFSSIQGHRAPVQADGDILVDSGVLIDPDVQDSSSVPVGLDVQVIARGCYSIQSPHNGSFMRLYHAGGLINDGYSFDFNANGISQAAKFYMQATGMNHFLAYDSAGRFLDTRFPADITAGKVTGVHAEWRIDTKEVGNEVHIRFTSIALDKWLRHNYNSRGIYFIDLLNPFFFTSEEWFRLVPAEGCNQPAEIAVNITGDLNALKSDVTRPVRGFIDPHAHITSYEFMGGSMMASNPFHKYGVTWALENSRGHHGDWGALDLIGNLMAYNDVNHRYDTSGWPNFPHWPNYKDMSHSGYYWKWMERAWKSGQRMIVSHVVENEMLCNLQTTLMPQDWFGNHNSCNTMSSVDLQIQRLNEMQTYIDAQFGGAGKGWFRLVYSAAEARQVIADGKLAVIIGMEVSEPFNCGIKDATCSQAYVKEQLQKYYDKGIRAMYPVHRFDNQFGGARIEHGLINAGNSVSSNHYFVTKKCDDQTQGQRMYNDLGLPTFLVELIGGRGTHAYDESYEHCNANGLTEIGAYLINEMINFGMIIEIDHMSQETHLAVLQIAEERNYSGLVSGHSHMHAAKDGGVHPNMTRIAELGGIIAPYNWDAHSISNSISNYLTAVEQTPYLNGVPFSTDMSGLGNMPGPRADVLSNPLQYPFTTEFGFVVNKQQSGNRTFDLNKDGIAHYGMLADHIQDIREQAPTRVYESIMNSAEAYLQMWERAEGNVNTTYVNPLPPYVTIFSRSGWRCLNVPGDDNFMSAGWGWVQLASCQSWAQDQKWLWNKTEGTFTSKAANNDGTKYCLDNNGNPWNNGYLSVKACNGSDQQRWTYNNQRLQSVQSGSHSVDAYGSGWIGFWSSHGNSNQQWELRLEDGGNRWVEYRNEKTGKCLTVQNANPNNNARIHMAGCNGGAAQKWLWNPIEGTFKTKLAGNRCLDVPGGNYSSDVQLILWDCHGGLNQKFERHGDNSFRTRGDNNWALDVYSGDDRMVLWWRSGSDSQRWWPTLP